MNKDAGYNPYFKKSGKKRRVISKEPGIMSHIPELLRGYPLQNSTRGPGATVQCLVLEALLSQPALCVLMALSSLWRYSNIK